MEDHARRRDSACGCRRRIPVLSDRLRRPRLNFSCATSLSEARCSAVDTTKGAASYAPMTDAVIGSEMEILSSWDLAECRQLKPLVQSGCCQAIRGLLPKRRPPGRSLPAWRLALAKAAIFILVSYKNAKPELTTLVLNELVNRYFNKHLEVHRSAGAFDFVTQQTDQVRARLNQTEDALREIKQKLKFFGKTDRLIGRAATVICGNHFIADYVESKGAKAVVIPTVVDLNIFVPTPDHRSETVLFSVGSALIRPFHP